VTLFDQQDSGSPSPAPTDEPPVESTGDRVDPLGAGEQVARVRMTLAYDGSGFRGIWPNRGVRTVVVVLQQAIEQVLGHGVTLACAGRTDAGVHAHGQVVSFDASRAGLDLDSLQRSLNSMCGPEIVVRELMEADAGFDARHSATARCYRYTILNRTVPDPFLAATVWHVPTPLDLPAMRLACDPLIGEHDFSSFCRRPKRRPDLSLRRRIVNATWLDLGDDLLRFDIEANAFCHQMVRSIMGTLVDVGLGNLRAGDISAIIRARDRQAAGDLAPPQGLTLWQVRYD
jgi:tRNA pseudouridine38-40 synthase